MREGVVGLLRPTDKTRSLPLIEHLTAPVLPQIDMDLLQIDLDLRPTVLVLLQTDLVPVVQHGRDLPMQAQTDGRAVVNKLRRLALRRQQDSMDVLKIWARDTHPTGSAQDLLLLAQVQPTAPDQLEGVGRYTMLRQGM